MKTGAELRSGFTQEHRASVTISLPTTGDEQFSLVGARTLLATYGARRAAMRNTRTRERNAQ